MISAVLLVFHLAHPGMASAAEQKPSPRTITLATDSWPPYYGPDLPGNGFLSEIVRAAFKEAGYHLDIHFTDWKTALSLSRTGKFDGLLGAYFQEQRVRHYAYSLPIVPVRTVFLARKRVSATYDGNLHNLKDSSIGVSAGYTYSIEFHAADYLTRVAATGPADLLQLLFTGKVDTILISEQVARYLLQRESS